MTESLTDEDRRDLRDTVVAYAVGVDDRDYDLLGDLFTDDAELSTPSGDVGGRDAIVAALRGIEKYDSTFHLLGQSWFWIDEDDGSVSGDTYCVAHHFTATEHKTMYIRYTDEFELNEDRWRISSRSLDVTREITAPA